MQLAAALSKHIVFCPAIVVHNRMTTTNELSRRRHRHTTQSLRACVLTRCRLELGRSVRIDIDTEARFPLPELTARVNGPS